MLVFHIFPRGTEARDAFIKEAEKYKDRPDIKVSRTTLEISQHGLTHKFYGGIDDRRLRGYAPDKFIIHDRGRCYDRVLEVVRYKEIFRGAKVVYV